MHDTEGREERRREIFWGGGVFLAVVNNDNFNLP